MKITDEKINWKFQHDHRTGELCLFIYRYYRLHTGGEGSPDNIETVREYANGTEDGHLTWTKIDKAEFGSTTYAKPFLMFEFGQQFDDLVKALEQFRHPHELMKIETNREVVKLENHVADMRKIAFKLLEIE